MQPTKIILTALLALPLGQAATNLPNIAACKSGCNEAWDFCIFEMPPDFSTEDASKACNPHFLSCVKACLEMITAPLCYTPEQ